MYFNYKKKTATLFWATKLIIKVYKKYMLKFYKYCMVLFYVFSCWNQLEDQHICITGLLNEKLKDLVKISPYDKLPDLYCFIF